MMKHIKEFNEYDFVGMQAAKHGMTREEYVAYYATPAIGTGIDEAIATADNKEAAFFASMLGIRSQSHLYHWQTSEYSVHLALGDFYDAYILLVDKLAEAILGNSERPKVGKAVIELNDYSEENVQLFIEDIYNLFKGDGMEIADGRTQIINVIDEIIAEADKLKYLLTLK
jgi:DNA-binding ferritin-like protein